MGAGFPRPTGVDRRADAASWRSSALEAFRKASDLGFRNTLPPLQGLGCWLRSDLGLTPQAKRCRPFGAEMRASNSFFTDSLS